MTGRLLIVAAALLWSTNGLFAKAPIFDDWPPHCRGTLLGFWRALFAGLFVLPLVRRPSWSFRMAPMAICFAAMNVTFLNALNSGTTANAIWLQSTAPFWVFLLALTRGNETFERRDLILLGSGVIGVGLILYFELSRSFLEGTSPWGVGFGLASGVLYAGVVISLRGLRAADSAWLVAVNHLFAAIALAPAYIHYGVHPSLTQLVTVAAFGALQMGLPYVLFTMGLRRVTSQEGAGIGLLEPVISPLWVFLAWGEAPRWWTLAGGAGILVGLLARYTRFGGSRE